MHICSIEIGAIITLIPQVQLSYLMIKYQIMNYFKLSKDKI
jgi:hypothetical protein